MNAATAVEGTAIGTRGRGSPLPALAGIGALAAFASAAVVFGDPLGGADDAAGAARELAGSSATAAAVLMGAYALLALVVVAALAHRLGRAADSPAVRALSLFGLGHVLLLAAAFVAPAGAVAVGTQVFDDGVSATATESALVLMNVAHPMAAWLGAGFLVAVVLAGRVAGAPRALVVPSAVFAAGLLLPPVGWAVTYLMAFWFAGVGIWLWLRG